MCVCYTHREKGKESWKARGKIEAEKGKGRKGGKGKERNGKGGREREEGETDRCQEIS